MLIVSSRYAELLIDPTHRHNNMSDNDKYVKLKNLKKKIKDKVGTFSAVQ